MSGIRTMSAAELLGVSPRALRDWERRFGYPKPRRTPAGHREYDRSVAPAGAGLLWELPKWSGQPQALDVR
jgi:hypothetical protein